MFDTLAHLLIVDNFRNESEKIDASIKYVPGLKTFDMIIVGFDHPGQIDNYAGRLKNALKAI
jgi:hypothetical protein